MVLSLVTTGSAWYSSSYSSQYQSSSGCAWDPWFGTQCGYSQSYSQQSSTSYGGYYPWGGDGEVVTTIPTLHGTMEAGDFGQMDHKLKM
jgi:hypothetical protein